MIEKVYTIPGAVKSVNYDNGTVEAIVSVTGNLDRQKDVILPGAYQKTLASGRLPKVVKQHDWKVWLGKTVDAEELKPGSMHLPEKLLIANFGGVYVKGEFTMEDPIAAAVHAHLKKGVIDEFSVGFDIDFNDDGSKAEQDQEDGSRHIKVIHPWYEWSPVLMGANPDTMPLSVKQHDPTLTSLEALEEAARVLMVPERMAYMLGLDLKSDVSTQGKRRAARFSMRVGGKVRYPINDCSDVRDAWALRGRSPIPTARVAAHVRRAASKLGCNGPWNSGKEADPAELADMVEWTLPSFDPDQLARIERAYVAIKLGLQALREMAQQSTEAYDLSNDQEDVSELSLTELGVIGATVAAARRRNPM